MLLEKGDWYWEGVLEGCDDCHDEYPMSWIIMCDNGIIRCFDCYYKNLKQEEEYKKNNVAVGE